MAALDMSHEQVCVEYVFSGELKCYTQFMTCDLR